MILLGTTIVATAGTAVQISDNTNGADSMTFKAPVGNTGAIYIGYAPEDPATSVTEADAFRLDKGEQITLSELSPSVFYADAATSGDKVTWTIVI